jgi:hypothetical protein
MKLISSFGLFLIAEWIWAATFARSYIFLNIIIMTLLLMIIAKVKFIPAMLQAFFSQLCALLVFTVFVHGVLDGIFKLTFQHYAAETIHPFAATFLLGVLYALLQSLFFYILSYRSHLPLRLYVLITMISNGLTTLVVYKFLPDYY